MGILSTHNRSSHRHAVPPRLRQTLIVRVRTELSTDVLAFFFSRISRSRTPLGNERRDALRPVLPHAAEPRRFLRARAGRGYHGIVRVPRPDSMRRGRAIARPSADHRYQSYKEWLP
jgi:hypothetical protein